MATDKKAFVLYANLIENIDHLTNYEKVMTLFEEYKSRN